MHERLKFKVHLSEQRGKDEAWGYQPVFSEAQYGTHFVINARFEGRQDTNGAINLDNIHFYLQNYTGEVTVGLEKFSLLEECGLHETRYQELLEPGYPNSKVYKITLFAKGFNNNFRHSHHAANHVTVLKPGDILVTEVVYLPVTKKLTFWDDENLYHQASYVDPIYQIRDGEDVKLTKEGESMITKLNQLGIVETANGEYDFGTIESFNVTDGVGVGRECKASVSMVI
ncbi:hypothetical protein [Fulvivirga sp.]|uniref:hypothetical protein n=1 Tax=Fulvivirga sp. TaxID=1931237 RepID=UPI0032EB1C5E